MKKEKLKTRELDSIPDTPDNSKYFFKLEKTVAKKYPRKEVRAVANWYKGNARPSSLKHNSL